MPGGKKGRHGARDDSRYRSDAETTIKAPSRKEPYRTGRWCSSFFA